MRRTFRLDGNGSGTALGPLEAQVMDRIWSKATWVSVGDIHAAIEAAGAPISYSTVKTVMNNLVEKGHLRKRSAGRANEFLATASRSEFERTVVDDVIRPLIANYRNPLLAHIVNQLDDENGIAELERLLAEKKAHRNA